MVYLGEKSIEQEIEMIKMGLLREGINNTVVFDEDLNPFDFNQEIYGIVKKKFLID